jgi:hypothetical protein
MNTVVEIKRLEYGLRIAEFIKSLKRQIEYRELGVQYAPITWRERMTECELRAIKRAEKIYSIVIG